MKQAVVIMTKLPQAGTVKTRLMPRLSGAECAALQMACLMDSCAAATAAGGQGYLFYAGDGPELLWDEGILAGFPPQAAAVYRQNLARMTILPQRAGDLGRRMDDACRRVLAENQRLVLTGTDIPGLSGPRLREGLRRLDSADLVLGPALDGGYYLVGLKKQLPEIFAGIPWGGSSVLAETLAAAGRLGLHIAQLTPERDLDTWADLCSYVHGDSGPADRERLMSYLCAAEILGCRPENAKAPTKQSDEWAMKR